MSKVTDPVHALTLGVADAHQDVTRVGYSITSQMNVGFRVVIQFVPENRSQNRPTGVAKLAPSYYLKWIN